MNSDGQTSLINWLQRMGGEENALQDSVKYDNEKTARLEFLSRTIGLPINRTDYVAGDKFESDMKELIARRGANTLLAFRVAPKESCVGAFDIVKKYGLTIPNFAQWLAHAPLDIAQADIRITDFRGELTFSAVFVISSDGIVGEVTNGSLYALTYAAPMQAGQHTGVFWQTGSSLHVSTPEFLREVQTMLARLHVADDATYHTLESHGFPVAHDFVCGYYEYVEGAGSAAFTDMNNKIISTNINVHETIRRLESESTGDANVVCRGMVACAGDGGTVRGTVRIVGENIAKDFSLGDILVAETTNVNHVEYMRRAGAIVTDRGGIMSHAAIVARELKKPCIIGTKIATQVLKDGDVVEVDADRGIVKVIEKAKK